MGYDFVAFSKVTSRGGFGRKMDIITDLISHELGQVEDEFKKHLKSQVPLISKICEYILLSGGKRFRPIITLLCAKL
jgi:octaprenyl-diphosphate synthase